MHLIDPGASEAAMTNEITRVLLADDHTLLRAGLCALLGSAKDIVVVGEANSGREAIALARRLEPDVVVMDLSMPDRDGLTATREILSTTRTRILVLTMHEEAHYFGEALRAGASGFLVKSVAHRELVDAIRRVASGEGYVRSAAQMLAKRLRSDGGSAHDRARFDALTTRERDVLRMVAAGHTAPEIGTRLSISPKTVDTYKHRINEKLSLTSRSDYVRFALRLGLLSAEYANAG
jgi:two-component system, NarL family, response regulator NreC